MEKLGYVAVVVVVVVVIIIIIIIIIILGEVAFDATGSLNAGKHSKVYSALPYSCNFPGSHHFQPPKKVHIKK